MSTATEDIFRDKQHQKITCTFYTECGFKERKIEKNIYHILCSAYSYLNVLNLPLVEILKYKS